MNANELIHRINKILNDYPEYAKAKIDEKKNIFIKKMDNKKIKSRDTLTDIVKRMLSEDLK